MVILNKVRIKTVADILFSFFNRTRGIEPRNIRYRRREKAKIKSPVTP